MSSQRWRAQGVERIGGRLVVSVEDRHGDARHAPGELVRVHYRLGRWRFYADDARLTERLADGHARTLAATAARALARHEATDPEREPLSGPQEIADAIVAEQLADENEKTSSAPQAHAIGQLFM